MSSVTVERTFSCLQRLKNSLQSTMTQKRLNDVTLMHTHKDRVNKRYLLDIATQFIRCNDRRRTFFDNINKLSVNNNSSHMLLLVCATFLTSSGKNILFYYLLCNNCHHNNDNVPRPYQY